MTSLDARVDVLRARAAAIGPPKVSTVLVTLLGLVPFLLGWVLNALWQVVGLVIAAAQDGWETGQAQMGPKPRPPGDS